MRDHAAPQPTPSSRSLLLLAALLVACREAAPEAETAEQAVGGSGAGGQAASGGRAGGGGQSGGAGQAGGAGIGGSGIDAFYGDECLPPPADFDRRYASCYYLYGAGACLEQGDPSLQAKVSGECYQQQIVGPYCFFGPSYEYGDSCCYTVSGGICNGRPLGIGGALRLASLLSGAW